eukprot:6198939-Pleurochrysis_carterae.AAC.1
MPILCVVMMREHPGTKRLRGNRCEVPEKGTSCDCNPPAPPPTPSAVHPSAAPPALPSAAPTAHRPVRRPVDWPVHRPVDWSVHAAAAPIGVAAAEQRRGRVSATRASLAGTHAPSALTHAWGVAVVPSPPLGWLRRHVASQLGGACGKGAAPRLPASTQRGEMR